MCNHNELWKSVGFKFSPFPPQRNITNLNFLHSRRSGTLQIEVLTIPAAAEHHKSKFYPFPLQQNIIN